jgi:hypothetical protein
MSFSTAGPWWHALERDYFIWIPSTDEAQSTIQKFTFPVGRGSEDVNPATTDFNFSITAIPIDGDGRLTLTAKGRHVVSYE